MFDSNVARDLGGAVYATSSHQAEFIFSHKCFISFRDSLHPDDWNTTFYFTNNKAPLGYVTRSGKRYHLGEKFKIE